MTRPFSEWAGQDLRLDTLRPLPTLGVAEAASAPANRLAAERQQQHDERKQTEGDLECLEPDPS